MECPYCKKEMTLGYVEQTDLRFPLRWVPAKNAGPTWNPFTPKGEIKLTSLKGSGNFRLYYCADCRKFVADQEELEA